MRSCCLCGAKVVYEGIFSIECAGFGCANSSKKTSVPIFDKLAALAIAAFGGRAVYAGRMDAQHNWSIKPPATQDEIDVWQLGMKDLMPEVLADEEEYRASQRKSA